jgi:antirestriction protein ArdC
MVVKGYNFVIHVWNELKLRRYVHEFVVKWMTSHQVLEMASAVRKTHLNTTLHVAHLSPQNTVLNFGNLQLDVSFQGFYVVRFFSVHSHLQVAPKKEIRRCQV